MVRRRRPMRKSLLAAAASSLTIGLMIGCAPEVATETASAPSQATSAPARFTYEDLVGLIRGQGLTSIEQVLPRLPAELRSGYALMRESRSLQFASASHPRVILYGRDARLTCAFSGDPNQPRFDTLECFQFREAERKFDFREIRFPTEDNGLGEVVFSEPNVSADGKTACTTCHGTDPRPNWNGYSQWPGAYGADNDTLGAFGSDYARFVERRPTDPRYRWLIQGPRPHEPFMAGGDFDHAHRPNLKLSDAINRANAFRTTRIMTSRVPPARSLAFAFKSLQCALSAEQRATLASAGVDLQAAFDRRAIFDEVRYSSALWGTVVLGDADSAGPYDHQSGYSFLAISMAMVMVQDLARAGDTRLQEGLAQLVAYTSDSSYTSEDPAYFAALDELVPDPQFFGGRFHENLRGICPALGDAFVAAATSR